MEKPIESVRMGLTKFTDEIIKRDIAARYMIVMFGVEPEIILDWVKCKQTRKFCHISFFHFQVIARFWPIYSSAG